MRKSVFVFLMICTLSVPQLAWSGFFDDVSKNISETLSGGEEKKESVIGQTDTEFWDTYQTNVLQGTLIGSGVGAVAGGLIGSKFGGKEGAMIGAAAGAVAGGAIGNAVGTSFAENAFDAVVTQDNAKEIIAKNEETIATMNESIAEVQKKTDKLTDDIVMIKEKFKKGEIDKKQYDVEVAAAQERVDIISESAIKVEDDIAGLEKQIAMAKKEAPDEVPAFEEQLKKMEEIGETIALVKTDADTALALL